MRYVALLFVVLAIFWVLLGNLNSNSRIIERETARIEEQIAKSRLKSDLQASLRSEEFTVKEDRTQFIHFRDRDLASKGISCQYSEVPETAGCTYLYALIASKPNVGTLSFTEPVLAGYFFIDQTDRLVAHYYEVHRTFL